VGFVEEITPDVLDVMEDPTVVRDLMLVEFVEETVNHVWM